MPEVQPGRYDVEIRGGKGNVVGDYATVVQVFQHAPTPLSSRIRTREFAALVADRVRNFVGRGFVFAALDDLLSDAEFPAGYVVVAGEPGIGKTAIMSRLVADRGYVHHFNVASLGIRSPQAFLSNVCAQLIVRYGLDHETVPAEAVDDGGFLSRLLAEAAAEPSNLPIVVAVDALDEAEDVSLPPGANRLFLPAHLPAGVYFVVSTREQADYRLFVESRREVYLHDNDARNDADIATYIREFVAANDTRMRPEIERWGVSEDEFIHVLTGRSAGNFMYLVHVLRDIRAGQLTAINVGDIRTLPQGLQDYYRRHWNDMREVDREQFRRYHQPVVCLLATAREPVTAGQLVEWTGHYWARHGWDRAALDRLAVKDVLATWREFFNTDHEANEPRYRVYHTSFRDFLAEQIGLAGYHATIGETALAKIPGFLGDA